MDVHLERTWDPADVTEDLRAALELVAELDPPADLRLPLFQFAAQLITQRAIRQSIGGVHLPPAGPLG